MAREPRPRRLGSTCCRVSRRPTCSYEGERVAGVVTGDLGVARDGSRKAELSSRLRAARQVHGVRGRLPRPSRPPARSALRLAHGRRPAALRARLQGDLANRRREAQARRDRAHARLAARRRDRRRRLRLPRSGRARVSRASSSAWAIAIRISIRSRSSSAGNSMPRSATLLAGGERISYGARAVNKGGLPSLPKLTFPGGVLVGCEAGFLNPAKIKGSHTALKSGMLAAESIFAALAQDGAAADAELGALCRARARIVALGRAASRPQFQRRHREARHARRRRARVRRAEPARSAARRGRCTTASKITLACAKRSAQRPRYPKPDGVVAFDRSTSVFLSSTAHEENQPCHLLLADPAVPIA